MFRSRRQRAYFSLALAMVTVGSIVPASKVIAGAMPPSLAGALRLAIAAAVLLPRAALRERATLLRWPDRHDAAILALQAAAGTVGFTVLMVLGASRTSAADASVVAGTLPAVAALVAVLAFRERPGARQWMAIALAVAGLAVVGSRTDDGSSLASSRVAGDLLVLGAVTCESLFILLQKRLHRPLPPLSQSAVMTALGLLYLLPLAATEASRLDLASVGAPAWIAVAYYGLVPTVLGFVWWYCGAQEVSGAEAGVFTAVMPLAGAGLSALVLGERLDGRHGVALTLVVAAIALSATGPDRAALPKPCAAAPPPASP